jgi:hypothetical protein
MSIRIVPVDERKLEEKHENEIDLMIMSDLLSIGMNPAIAAEKLKLVFESPVIPEVRSYG